MVDVATTEPGRTRMNPPRRTPPLLAAAVIALLVGTGLTPGPSASASTSLSLCRPSADAPHPVGKAARITGWLHSCPDGTIRNARGKKIRIEALEYLRLG